RAGSACGMWAAFEGGSRGLTPATLLISGAGSSILARVSRTAPAGGAETPGIVGCSEWQGAQRWAITDCTCPKVGAGPEAAAEEVFGRSQIASATSAIAAVTRIHHASRP